MKKDTGIRVKYGVPYLNQILQINHLNIKY